MYPLFCISDAVKQLKFGVSNNAIESHMDNAMSSSCYILTVDVPVTSFQLLD